MILKEFFLIKEFFSTIKKMMKGLQKNMIQKLEEVLNK